MFYPTYRSHPELNKCKDYGEWSASQIGSILVEGAQLATADNKISLILSAEIVWVLDKKRLTYYLSRDITEFLLNVGNKDESIDFANVKGLHVYSFSAHPSFKLLPCLVEISGVRMVCHIQSRELQATESAIMYPGDKFIWNEDFEGVGNDMLIQCTKIAWGIHMMTQAFPDLIQDGFPDDMKERSIRHAKKPTARKFQLPEQLRNRDGRLKPGTHWRHWHWRHLRDERYKRNPDGSIKVILISDTIVNRNKAKAIQ